MAQFSLQDYLKDLLEFTKERVQFSPSGPPPPNIRQVGRRLAQAFHQPFDRLIEDELAAVGIRPVQQVRLAVETLRQYLAALSVETASADQGYLQAAYQALLMNLGTSFEEIRLVRAAGDDEIEQVRAALAERLGIDRPERLDALFFKLEELTEEKLAAIFGLVSTRRDPFEPDQAQPALLKWRMDHLRLLWQVQDQREPMSEDEVGPILDPDLIEEQMIIDPEQMGGLSFVDSNIIDASARREARTLWRTRAQEINAMIADIHAKIQEAVRSQPTLLAAYDRVLAAFLGSVNLESALAFRTETAPDPHQEANRPLETVSLGALRRLVRLRKLAESGTLTEAEWADATAILVQLRKQQRYSDWRAEERAKGLLLAPDFFIPSGTGARQALPPWRATAQARSQWEDTLRARLKQAQTIIQSLQSALDATEQTALLELREALIAALAKHINQPVENLADRLTTRLLVDFKNRSSRRTTRLAQAIETVCGFFFALRMGRPIDVSFSDDNPARAWKLKFGNAFTEADFDTEWQWMGAYAMRRAVEFVKDHPETYLLPSLRDEGEAGSPPTSSFWHLIANLRARSRLTPGEARELANDGIGEPALDNPNLGYLRHLRLQGVKLPVELSGSFTITEQLTEGDFLARRQLVEKLFNAQKLTRAYESDNGQVIQIEDPHRAPNWLQEIFYFVPMAIALQLQRSGEYLAALDWYQTVYAYQLPVGQRTIYHGLQLEGVFSERPRITPGIWLREELNPHYFARERKHAYTRFTIMSIVQCLLDYADSEFTLESDESLPRARALYLSALDLLGQPVMPASNPMLEALRRHADLSLDKLRSGRNIAGMERPPERDPAAETGTSEAMPDVVVIGSGGQLVLRQSVPLQPTPYRYAALIERAKQLVGIAQQMEAAYLAALEKHDAEAYNLLRARQDLKLSQATITLQDLRVSEAATGQSLATLQRSRAEIQRDTFQGWIDAGLNQWEQSMIDGYQEAAAARLLVNFFDTTLQFIQIAASAAAGGAFGAPAAAPLVAAAALVQQGSYAANAIAIGAETQAQVAAVHASHERRKEEWQLQKSLAEKDVDIAGVQISLANQQKQIVEQERIIAGAQADHAQATVDFLANKFTNADLYEWMSGILARVYSYFLQQATATAQLAQNQLAFERQEPPPLFIQGDYWRAPAEPGAAPGANGNTPDRRGLTGSARLLQDIYQLDQYAFETNKRKLQLSQTFSLARLLPFEFQQFRNTGVLQFATPLELFDRGFPGHYLRLIKRLRTSLIALVPPTQGIRASLTASGISRVVVGPDIFRTIEVRRSPELIAFTSPNNATGLFELEAEGEMLLPFEGMGVDATWRLEMPHAANPFDYRTIADVLIAIDYTALHSYDYRQQVVQRLDSRVGAERSFSFRQEFADQWFDLNNPEQTSQSMVVRFETSRADFPPNVESLAIDHLLLYFSRTGGAFSEEESFEVQVKHLHFSPRGDASVAGGGASSSGGVISTRRANGSSWLGIQGKSPVGEWELALPNTDELRRRFKKGEIEDILFVIAYAGRTPAWPV
jgi:hypothetical protein